MSYPIYVVLDNIRSAYNVGSIFRTAEGAGVEKIYLCGHTPTPIDRFGRKRKDISKVSLGADVKWEYRKDILPLINELKNEAVKVVSVEQDKRSIDYKNIKLKNVAYIFGNEVNGLDKEVLSQSDLIVEIPMKGKKESLNVAVSVGIVLFNVV